MVAVLREEPHFCVPARHAGPADWADGNQARLLLAGRIAGLSGIRTVDNGSDPVPSSVSVFVVNEHGPARKRTAPRTLCVLSRDGITVNGLNLREQRHLMAQGWATLQRDRIQVPYPRTATEVEVCWAILQHAHCSLLDVSARSPRSRQGGYGELPRFSRTTLQ